MPSAGASSSSGPSPPSTPLPVPVKLRRSTQEMFEDCYDATGAMDECLCKDVSDRRAHGLSHMALKGIICANFSHAARRCTRAPHPHSVDWAAARAFWIRGTPVAIEQHIAGPWHSVAPQESSEFLGANVIKNDFHVAHFRGCSALFNKNTFEPDLETKSLFVSGDHTGLQRLGSRSYNHSSYLPPCPHQGQKQLHLQ